LNSTTDAWVASSIRSLLYFPSVLFLPPHGLIDRPDLRAVADPERLGEAGAIIGIEHGAGRGAGDGITVPVY
jgi:hypothetical protein